MSVTELSVNCIHCGSKNIVYVDTQKDQNIFCDECGEEISSARNIAGFI